MATLKKLIPLADRVLVRRIVPAAKTAGGVILPDSNVSKPNEAVVLAVGPGIHTRDGLIPVTVKAGDKVLLPEYGGLQLKIDGEDVYIFTNHEILAKFE